MRRKGFGQRRAEREKAVIILRLQISALIMLRSLKTDSSRNVPLENAGFTLYDTEDNIVQNRTAVYMWQNEISISDPNYDSSSGRYHRGDTSYTVYS